MALAFPSAPIPLWPEAPGGAPGPLPTLTGFCTAGDEGRPRGAVLVFPGGAYRFLAPAEADPVALFFRDAGLASFVVRYRVAPHRHPAPLEDARRAVRLVRHRASEWNVDPARIAVLGFSAGGHLAAALAALGGAANPEAADPVDRQDARPDALVSCYAPLSLRDGFHGGCRQNLLGPEPPEALLATLSVDEQVTPAMPPAFLWHTLEDEQVPAGNALRLAAALARHRVPFEAHLFPTGRHGLVLAQGHPLAARWPALCLAWLGGLGWATPPAS